MLFSPEMPPSRYDLNFVLFGIPVRVQVWFWIVTLLFAARGDAQPAELVLWVVVVFCSVLLHEMGHALAAKSYGWAPQITLHGFGGFARYLPTYRTRYSTLLISAAGPAIGFALAGLIVGILNVAGLEAPLLGWNLGGSHPIDNSNLRLLVSLTLYANIFWGLLNLLPIYPLDGGQIARELLALVNPVDAARQSLWLSVITGVGMAALALKTMDSHGSLFLVLFFGYLAMLSYQALEQGAGRRY